MTEPVEMMVHRPILIDVLDVLDALGSDEGALVRVRSPRRWTSAMITVLPPRVMLGVPVIFARRDTLFPLSYGETAVRKERIVRHMYSAVNLWKRNMRLNM
jgi:hypothetical protein